MKKNSLIPMTVKACLALATMGCVATANAVLLDFNTLPAGKIVTDDYDDNPDIGLTVTGIGGADLCVLYPSHVSGGSDPDLEGPPFAGGGNAANDFVGNVLIVQEVQSLGGGVCLGPVVRDAARR